MEFNTQICTTREQSKRLLAMGLKPETADMCWHYTNSRCEALQWQLNPHRPTTRKTFTGSIERLGEDAFDRIWGKDIPAWSLHRIMIIANIGKSGFTNVDEAYNTCISLIASHIRFGLLNKEYFKQ